MLATSGDIVYILQVAWRGARTAMHSGCMLRSSRVEQGPAHLGGDAGEGVAAPQVFHEGALKLLREALDHCRNSIRAIAATRSHTAQACLYSVKLEGHAAPLSGASPNTIICRLCDSLVRWHLKPFSSRHCFWHIWQYHRSFCRPFALMRLAICAATGTVWCRGKRFQRAFSSFFPSLLGLQSQE